MVTVGCVAASLMWLRRWPTHTQSARFVVAATFGIAVSYLTAPDPLVALLSCTAFASLGGYIAFFHTARYMAFNLAVAALTASALAVRVAAQGDVLLAVSRLAWVLAVIVTVPLTAQVLVHFFGADLVVSDTDPLTGLLNRRALKRAVLDLLAVEGRGAHPDRVAVVMIDLDNFKLLNDSSGHAAGDRALVAIGQLIRQNCRECAVVARAGGEEFLVVDVLTDTGISAVAEKIRASIAGSPYPITGSVGTASAALEHPSPLVGVRIVEDLIAVADEAMYEAKRAGGDGIRHRRGVGMIGSVGVGKRNRLSNGARKMCGPTSPVQSSPPCPSPAGSPA
jgi:diguanylate cyclase (GGDEF)-like protein